MQLKQGLFVNLKEVLPEWWTSQQDTDQLLSKIGIVTARMMPDNCHYVSNDYLNKCILLFKKLSEDESMKMIKNGYVRTASQ